MRLSEWVRAALGTVIIGPFVLVSIPFLLPVAIVSVTLAKRRFWRLRTGDVLGASFVVLHPPKKGSEFRLVELLPPCGLHVWKIASDAHSDLEFRRILPETLTEIMFNPMRCTGRLPLSKVAELLAATRYCWVHDTVHRSGSRHSDEVERFWRQLTEFELLRPVRLIQRAWRAHAARRRRAAARVITRAALHFLYRPRGRGYEAASRRWPGLPEQSRC